MVSRKGPVTCTIDNCRNHGFLGFLTNLGTSFCAGKRLRRFSAFLLPSASPGRQQLRCGRFVVHSASAPPSSRLQIPSLALYSFRQGYLGDNRVLYFTLYKTQVSLLTVRLPERVWELSDTWYWGIPRLRGVPLSGVFFRDSELSAPVLPDRVRQGRAPGTRASKGKGNLPRGPGPWIAWNVVRHSDQWIVTGVDPPSLVGLSPASCSLRTGAVVRTPTEGPRLKNQLCLPKGPLRDGPSPEGGSLLLRSHP